MNGFEAVAAARDLADWSDGEIAGGGPPKHVAQHAAERTRQIAYAATMAARGRISPGDLGGMLLPEDGAGGDTLMLRHREPKPAGRHRGRGVARCVRQLLGQARAWLSS